MGNGAKAQQKRERNDKKGPAGGKSQIKTNAASLNIVCTVCKQAFMNTTRAPALQEHADNKHSKTLKDCFPTFAA